jgi:hypothetical protein
MPTEYIANSSLHQLIRQGLAPAEQCPDFRGRGKKHLVKSLGVFDLALYGLQHLLESLLNGIPVAAQIHLQTMGLPVLGLVGIGIDHNPNLKFFGQNDHASCRPPPDKIGNVSPPLEA